MPLLSDHEVTGFDFSDMSKSTIQDYQDALTKAVGNKQFDVLIHLGALVHSQSDDPIIFHWNTICSEILFSRYSESKIIFISSNMAVNPVNHYGRSKELAERFLRLISRNYCILRPSAIFGEAFDRSSPLPVIDLIVTGRIEKLYADYTRDFIHVNDVAKAIADTVEKKHTGTFNLGTGIGYSAVDLAYAFGANNIPIIERPKTVPAESIVGKDLFPFSWEPLDSMEYLKKQRGNR